MPIIRLPLACRCGNHRFDIPCLSVGFQDWEWEWLEAEAAYATEFDRRVRVFTPEEVVLGIVGREIRDRPPANVLRDLVAASKDERAQRGDVRWYD